MTFEPRNITQLEHQELRSPKSGEKFSHSASLSELLGLKEVFVHHEVIPPGRRASSPHRHSTQEEMIVVLSGSPTAHLGGEARQLKKGDFLGFEPAVDELHFIENTTDATAEILVIASKRDDDQAIYN